MADLKRIDIYVGTVGQAYMDKETAKINVERAKQNMGDWKEIYELAAAYIDDAEFVKQNAEEAKNRAEQIYAYLESLIWQNEGLVQEQLNELKNEVNDNDYDNNYSNGGGKYTAQTNLDHIIAIINDLTTILQKSNTYFEDWSSKVEDFEVAYEIAEEVFRSYLPEEDNNELDRSDALEQEFREKLESLNKQLKEADDISKNVNDFTDYTNEEINKILNGDYTKPVLSISVIPSKAILKEGESITLTASIYPSDASNKNVSWMASNGNVELSEETNESVKVTFVSEGEATVTAVTEEGGKSAASNITCKVEQTTEPDPEEPQGQYKWCTFTLTEDEWRTNYNQDNIKNIINEAWNNPNGYVNNRPTTYSIPQQSGDVYFVGILFPTEFGVAEWDNEINGAKMSDNKYTPLPEGAGGIYLTYENLTNSFIASGAPAKFSWVPATFNN